MFPKNRILKQAVLLGSTLLSLITYVTPLFADASTPYYTASRYSVGGQLLGIIRSAPNELGHPAERYTYDQRGLLVETEYGALKTWQDVDIAPSNWSDFVVSYKKRNEYNDLRWLVLSASVSPGGDMLALTQYSYDAYGRQVCKAVRMNPATYHSPPSDACELGTTGAYGPDRITRYVYDKQDNLLEEHRAVGTSIEQVYAKNTYDKNGKRTSVTDANGNMTSDGASTYVYDVENRLISARAKWWGQVLPFAFLLLALCPCMESSRKSRIIF